MYKNHWKYFSKPYLKSSVAVSSEPFDVRPTYLFDSDVNSAAKTGRFWISYDDSLTERKDHTSPGQKEDHVCYSPVLR